MCEVDGEEKCDRGDNWGFGGGTGVSGEDDRGVVFGGGGAHCVLHVLDVRGAREREVFGWGWRSNSFRGLSEDRICIVSTFIVRVKKYIRFISILISNCLSNTIK